MELLPVRFIEAFLPTPYCSFPVIDSSGDLFLESEQFFMAGVIRTFLDIPYQMLDAFYVPEMELLVVIDCVVVVMLISG